MELNQAAWTTPPPPGDLMWEFVRAHDGTVIRCEVRAAAPGLWQVIVYVDGLLLAWHSGFSYRKSAEEWATHTRLSLARGRGPRRQASTLTTNAPPVAPPTLYCQQCAAKLEYLRSYVTHTGRVSNQWDRLRCPKGCGEFEFRPRTRRLKRAPV